jgi:hypothetical protein
MRIITLLARHGNEAYPDAVSNVDDFFAGQLSAVDHEMVIIDNSLPEGLRQTVGPGCAVIGGSNALWEFSAWDSGVEYLGDRISDFDFVHLATSAFKALDCHYLDCFSPEMLSLVLGKSTAVGHIDYYPAPIVIEDESSQAWLRSSWILLPWPELKMLRSVVSLDDRSVFFSGSPDAPFREDAPLSINYERYIVGWLTGGGTGVRNGALWHSRLRLGSETLEHFEAKSMAILNEHMLSIRLRLQGCSLVDASWLSVRSTSLQPDQALGMIPNWKLQVSERERWPTEPDQI